MFSEVSSLWLIKIKTSNLVCTLAFDNVIDSQQLVVLSLFMVIFLTLCNFTHEHAVCYSDLQSRGPFTRIPGTLGSLAPLRYSALHIPAALHPVLTPLSPHLSESAAVC